MHLPIPKDRTVTGAIYINVDLKKLNVGFKRRRPKTGLEYLRLLHDIALAHRARTETEFLESEKVNVLPHTPFSPGLAPCDFSNSNSICLEKNISQEMLLGLLYIRSSWVCIFRTMSGVFKIGLTA